MIVVADASPLHYLILIEQITVLPPLYGQVIAPSVVCEELQRPQTPEIVQRWIASPPLWLDMHPPQAESDRAITFGGRREASYSVSTGARGRCPVDG